MSGNRTAKISAMKGAPTNLHSRCVAQGAAGPRVSATSAAMAAAPVSWRRSSPCAAQCPESFSCELKAVVVSCASTLVMAGPDLDDLS